MRRGRVVGLGGLLLALLPGPGYAASVGLGACGADPYRVALDRLPDGQAGPLGLEVDEHSVQTGLIGRNETELRLTAYPYVAGKGGRGRLYLRPREEGSRELVPAAGAGDRLGLEVAIQGVTDPRSFGGRSGAGSHSHSGGHEGEGGGSPDLLHQPEFGVPRIVVEGAGPRADWVSLVGPDIFPTVSTRRWGRPTNLRDFSGPDLRSRVASIWAPLARVQGACGLYVRVDGRAPGLRESALRPANPAERGVAWVPPPRTAKSPATEEPAVRGAGEAPRGPLRRRWGGTGHRGAARTGRAARAGTSRGRARGQDPHRGGEGCASRGRAAGG